MGLMIALEIPSAARNLIGPASGSGSSGHGSSAAISTSQTATAATTATAQAAQAAITSQRARDSLVRSTAAFQSIMQAQAAAQQVAAQASAANGLQVGGLNPAGGIPATTGSPSIQIVQLGGAGKGQLVLSSGGTVTLPNGISGNDTISVSGAGSVTTTSGTVTSSSGSLSTTAGGTLSAINGGTISLTAGSATLNSATPTALVSTLGGTYTPPGGTAVTFSANQATSVPTGSTVSFTGTGAGTVTLVGSGTVTLAGAGTLALPSATVGTGGTISTNTGTTTFTSATVSSQALGTSISLNGGGTVNFTGGDVLPVIVQPTAANTPPAFTTTGTLLTTAGYVTPPSWSGVGALSQTVNAATGQTTVTVTQNQSQALLNWQTFNVGKSTTLDFDQSAGGANVGDWVAFNRILDPSLNPSQIFGVIQAPGQVYVINQNGIIFNGTAQVNTHALVASTLPINSNLIANGLLNNPGGQFLFTSIAIPSNNGSNPYDPNNDPNALPNSTSGSITVDEGATLYSPGSPEGVGGRIALIAPSIDNEGVLSSPDGQIILAAAQQVGFTAHASTDPSLRGLDVALGQANGTEAVTNGANGLIYAPEADVTMTAPTVNQFGIIDSTTSVALNGRIDLLAVDNLAEVFSISANAFVFGADSSSVGGAVNLGPNSITEILPDYSSTATEVGSSLALPSQIYIEGQSFHMESGAQVLAPNATATLSLGIVNTQIASKPGQEVPVPENVTSSTLQAYLPTAGQVTFDANTSFDVSGSSDVQASVTDNIVSADMTEAVLENSSLQETGPLRGQTVQVDITQTGINPDGSLWYGSPIGDLSGYVNLVPHTVGELTVAGGSVAINTNGAVTMDPTSTINVSGGSIDYQGATVQTTNVTTSAGQVINISQATPDQTYEGITTGFTVDSSKYGISQTYSNPLQSSSYFDPGYVEGGSGGTLNIQTSSAQLSGQLYGNTFVGARQQLTPPTAGTLNLAIQASNAGPQPPAVDVVIQPVTDAETDPGAIYLSPALFGANGFGNSTISSGNGLITVSPDAVVSTTAGGSFDLIAANLDIAGQILAPSGSITLTALPSDPVDYNDQNPTAYNSAIGQVTVASGATISTDGFIFDETSDIAPGTLPFGVNGGTIAISGSNTMLAAGSTVQASGGATRNVNGKISNGKGGSISLTGVYDAIDNNPHGSLVLDGDLSAYGVGQGGSLTLQAPTVQVGSGSAPALSSNLTPLVLSPSFFGQGGFSSFSVTGQLGVEFLNGSSIAPNLIEESENGNGQTLGLGLVSSSQLPSYPTAPISLAFSAPGIKNTTDGYAQISLDNGAAISAPATGSVTLSGQLDNILGGISAPGGQITITGDSTSALTGSAVNSQPPDVTVYLGSQSNLSVAGEVLTTPTPKGYQVYTTGEVLGGGSIKITGNIVGDANSSLNANGALGVLDVPYAQTNSNLSGITAAFQRSSNPFVQETIGSNGGSITLNGIEELYFGGSVSASAGNSSASGGTLSVGSGIAATSNLPTTVGFAGYPELFISQTGTYSPGTVLLGQPLSGVAQTDGVDGLGTGGGYFTVGQYAAGQFGSLILNGNVQFQSNVDITATQKVEIVPDSHNGTIFANPAVAPTIDITAPYIAIGATSLSISNQSVSAFAPSYASFTTTAGVTQSASPQLGLATPTYGAGSLSLNATDLIDVGFLSLQNIGATNFAVPTGDLRGGGLFYAAGSISLQAGQIYTPTAANFTVAAFDYTQGGNSFPGEVTILPGVARPLPLSAGGTINIYASDITQDGVLEAPFGTINLGAISDPSSSLTPMLPSVQFNFDFTTGTYVGSAVSTQYAPVTKQLVLGSGSVTSVSGVSASGQVLDLPYGTILNGTDWIAPNGADITEAGPPAKAINLEGTSVQDEAGSLINLAGGGDLFAYEFNSGVTGTNDILSIDKYADGAIVTTSAGVPVASTSFAILPSYGINYAPVDLTIDRNGALPYANSSVTSQVGNDVYLAGGDGVPAGSYTILPARYALLPGAFLVTPTAGTTPTQASPNPDGSVETAGYIFNSLNPNQAVVPNVTGFQVDSNGVVSTKAQYAVSSANTYFPANAAANFLPVPRLPVDAGQLVFSATSALNIEGQLAGQGAVGGLGSNVDIGSPYDIYIVSNQGDNPTLNIPPADTLADYSYLTLAANELDAFGADSLLVGGIRSYSGGGTTVNPVTSAIYVENDAASPLKGNEVILASKQTITLENNASIQQSGTVSSNEQNLTTGDAATPGSGDGTLIRVTGDPDATFTRLGVNTSDSSANLVIGAGASISGVALTLDSSSGAQIDPNALIDQGVKGRALVLSSGAISLQIDPTVSLASAPGLAVDNGTLQNLQNSVGRLSLSSYSTINLYGAGTLGALDSSGQPIVQELSLSGAGILGYASNGGTVTLNAQNVSINNAGNQSLGGLSTSAPIGAQSNSLVINADTINLASNAFAVEGYSSLALEAGTQISASGTGGISTQGGLNLQTPFVGGTTGANYTFNAEGGDLVLSKPITTTGTPTASGLGATISFIGTGVTLGSEISTPSGVINATATSGNVDVAAGGDLEAGGHPVAFNNVIAYTNAGGVSLSSPHGNVSVDSAATINLAAQLQGGNAGTLDVSAPTATLTMNGSLEGEAGAGGAAGIFNAQVGAEPMLSNLTTPLTEGGFGSLTFDVMTGTVTVDGAIGAALASPGLTLFSLTAEEGGITIDNTINASGPTGGTIDLYANQDVTLTAHSNLTAAGQQFNAAGQGGSIDLETRGAGTNGIDIMSGSQINLSVAYLPVLLPEASSGQGNSITLSEAGTFLLPSGTPSNDQIEMTSGGTITAPGGATTTFTANEALSNLAAGSEITLSNPGTVIFVSGGTGGTVPVWLSSSANFTSSGATNANGSAALTAAYAGDVSGTLHLRAPTINNDTDLAIAPIQGSIAGASSIVLEGYNVYNTASTGGQVTSALEGSATNNETGTIYGDAQTFANNTAAILERVLGLSAAPTLSQEALYQVTPGAEITNPTGNLTLANNWDLSTSRFGPNNVAGDLTLRASGNLIFNGSLTDGFAAANVPLVSSVVTSNSAIVGLISTTGLEVGEPLVGAGIPTGDTISTILNSTQAGVSFSSGVQTLTLASISGLSIGEIVSGPGIPTGDYITARSGNSITLKTATTAAESNETITVQGVKLNTKATANENELVSVPPYLWNVQPGPSWSYRLVAGANFGSQGGATANFGSVQSLSQLGLTNDALTNAAQINGSLLLGKVIPAGASFGANTATIAENYAQLIRTGTGSITIDTGGSVDLMNQLASIYTAGTVAPSIAGFSSPTPAGLNDSSFETQVYGQNIAPAPQYTAQYTENGGNVTINAQQDIAHLTQNSGGTLVPDTSWQMPTNWLYRRGALASAGNFDATVENTAETASTTWWIDFSNFFQDIGALGGGNVSIAAGGNIVNVDAVVPTNARLATTDSLGNPVADTAGNLVELGGGNLSVTAGGAIEGGTYYVEQGTGTITANTISSAGDTARISAYDLTRGFSTPLPLTLFVGDSSFTVNATNDVVIGSTVNPFWLPQGMGNSFNNETIFSTFSPGASVNLSSLLGNITVQGSETSGSALPGSLYDAYLSDASPYVGGTPITVEQTANAQEGQGGPWTLTLDSNGSGTGAIDNVTNYLTFFDLSPPTFRASAYAGSIQYQSDQLLAPSAQGTLQLLAANSIDGAFNSPIIGNGHTASITVLDNNPSALPGVINPIGLGISDIDSSGDPSIASLFAGTLADVGQSPTYFDQSFQTLESYHTSGLLHDNSTTPPVEIETIGGNIGDLTLISPERTLVSSGLDMQDVSFYIQNNNANDISVVSATRNITLYDPTSTALVNLGAADSNYVAFGDIQISGPGTLEVLAGGQLNLGEGTPPENQAGTGLGITSIGNLRNPFLPADLGGATIVAAAGLGDVSGLSTNPENLDYQAFISAFLGDPAGVESARYLPDLGALLGASGATNSQILDIYNNTPDASLTAQELQIQASLTPEQRDVYATTLYYDVLRDAGRDHNNPSSNKYGTYAEAYAAIADLFPASSTYHGDISLTSREFKTVDGGDINLLAPGGGIDVGLNNLGTQAADQGILTVDGGNISIYTQGNVAVGTSRIFTLHGGNIIIYSSTGNIAAGAASKTVQSAPPTQVIVDSQSANVQTDLAGLATGGGIGVLETVVGAPPGNVDLIAPVGTVDAGDAGIRSSGNINVAAARVLNASNIQAGGASTGVPATSAPSISASVAAAGAGAGAQNAANQAAVQQQPNASPQQELPSIITVQVVGYGGDDSADLAPDPTSPAVAATPLNRGRTPSKYRLVHPASRINATI